MVKIIYNSMRSVSLFKSILFLLVGVIMIIAKTDAMELIVQLLGGLMLILGILPVFLSLIIGRLGVFSLLFSSSLPNIVIAVLLLVFSGPVSAVIRYVLGGLMLVGGIFQLFSVYRLRGTVRGGYFVYVIPVLLILLGILFFSPSIIGRDIFGLIAGIAFVLYGISGLITYFRPSVKTKVNADKGDAVKIDDGSSVQDAEEVDYWKVD